MGDLILCNLNIVGLLCGSAAVCTTVDLDPTTAQIAETIAVKGDVGTALIDCDTVQTQ